MRKIKLTESELVNIIKQCISEGQQEIDSILDKINSIFENLI